jgi:hypothetical protein
MSPMGRSGDCYCQGQALAGDVRAREADIHLSSVVGASFPDQAEVKELRRTVSQ